MNISDYGIIPLHENLLGIPARITAQHKERYGIVCEHGITHAKLKTKEYYVDGQDFPTTGDFVMVNYIENSGSQIIATLPRKTFFSRRDPTPGRGEQAVAANFDYVFIMQSLNLDFNPKRLERYLTLAWQSGATPVILLTKADLVEDYWDYLTQVERLTANEYIEFLKHTDLGSQYPKERFRERIATLVARVSISLVARNEEGAIVGVCFGITDFAYWLFITDLGVVRECAGRGIGTALVRKLHELAGGEENIIMYTCFNENAYGFYEKLGMWKPKDVVVLNKAEWTDFTVE